MKSLDKHIGVLGRVHEEILHEPSCASCDTTFLPFQSDKKMHAKRQKQNNKDIDKWGIRTPAGKTHENAPVDTGKLALESHAITTRPTCPPVLNVCR